MGRLLKSGEYKPAPSAAKRSARLSGPTQFEDALRRGTSVKVYVGSGFEKGTIVEWTKDRVVVRLNRGSRNVTCYDARNLEVL